MDFPYVVAFSVLLVDVIVSGFGFGVGFCGVVRPRGPFLLLFFGCRCSRQPSFFVPDRGHGTLDRNPFDTHVKSLLVHCLPALGRHAFHRYYTSHQFGPNVSPAFKLLVASLLITLSFFAAEVTCGGPFVTPESVHTRVPPVFHPLSVDRRT